MRMFCALLSELGFPLDGRRAMRPDVIVLMIYFSQGTVPKLPRRSNSKGGSIDNRIGIVRTRNACRMNIRGKGIFLKWRSAGRIYVDTSGRALAISPAAPTP
jgi:hypothetical protein